MSLFLPINLANVAPAEGFDYPPGTYLFKVHKVETKTNKDGESQRLVVTSEIVAGPGPSTQFATRKMMNSYQLTEQGAPFLKRFLVSCGITDEFIASQGGNVDADWILGRNFVAKVIKNGQYTNMGNERPAEEWNSIVAQEAAGNGTGQKAAPAPSLLTPTTQPPPAAQPPQQFVQPQQFAQPQMQQPQMQQPQQFAQPQMQQPAFQQPPQPQPQPQQPAFAGGVIPPPQGSLPQQAAGLPQAQFSGQPGGNLPLPTPPPGTVGQL